MLGSFRQSLAWLHTWLGLAFGFVVVVIFFFGTLSVFDREIDRWALPETRFAPQPLPSFDHALRPHFERITPDVREVEEARGRVEGALANPLPLSTWSVYATHRDPVFELYAEYAIANNPANPFDHVHGHVTIDPRNGAALTSDSLSVGTELFYPLHYGLQLSWKNLGYWLVGASALVLLLAQVSGVVMHRRLLRELFTFRPDKAAQRRLLDLHNLSGVLGLPFQLAFALTGLLVFAGVYFPLADAAVAPLAERHAVDQARVRGLPSQPSGKPGPLASVDAMVSEAKRIWAARGTAGDVGYLTINHVGDASSYVSIYRAGSDRVALLGHGIHFEGATGRVLSTEPPPGLASRVSEFATGLHLQHFRNWKLRWLYFLGGLTGCACAATGLLLFAGKRRTRHLESARYGALSVDVLTVTAVTGMVLATLGVLVATRLLPAELSNRGIWQARAFWFTWLAAAIHAAVRSLQAKSASVSPAWGEQCWAITALAAAAALLNGALTGDTLLHTIGRNWAVAGCDLVLLATAVVAALVAQRLRSQRHSGRCPVPPWVAAAAEARRG